MHGTISSWVTLIPIPQTKREYFFSDLVQCFYDIIAFFEDRNYEQYMVDVMQKKAVPLIMEKSASIFKATDEGKM